jgi:hypothetical protein
MASPAGSTIIDLARGLIREELGSDVPSVSDAFMLSFISDADKELLRAFRKGGGNTPSASARETGYTLASDTAINDVAGITSASVTITVDSTTGFAVSGTAVIWDGEAFDIFSYTGITATSFTGVTGIAFDHEDNTEIQAVYVLPTNFKAFRRTEDYGDGVLLNSAPLTYMEAPPNAGRFSIVDDGTNKYLWLYRGASGEASVYYDKTSPTIDTIDDTVSFDEEYTYFYVWRCIEMSLFGRGDYAIIGLAKQKGDAIKLDALKDRNIGRRLRVRQFGSVGDRNFERLAIRESSL